MVKMLEVLCNMVNLATLSMVLILSLGVPHLTLSCPHSCACYFSTEVHCTFRSLTAVPTRIPKEVERINLGFNNIQSVSKISFHGLQKLELLMLHGNEIQRLPDGAFKDLQSLQVLKMSYNKVSAITAQTFQGLVNLLRLHIDHNKIEFIQPGAFYGLTSLKMVHLEGNLLQQIHPSTFVTFSFLQHFKVSSIKHLYLSDNFIRTLPREMLHSMSKLESIYLHGNPWSCDCRLKWLLDWEREAGGVVKCKKDRTYPGGRLCSLCSKPKQFTKKELFKLDSNVLTCTKPTIISPLKKTNISELEDNEGEDISHQNYQKLFGSMTLNLTDQQGNLNHLVCHVNRLRNDTTVQWHRLNEQEIAVNMTLSVTLICHMDQEKMQRLWKLIAYYSETPVRLERDLMLSKEPNLSYRYKQAVDNDAYYYTGVRAEVMAESSWLMQKYINIQLDRRQTTASHVVLLFSMYLSQHFPISNAAKAKNSWVSIKEDEGTKRDHVLVTGTMLQLNCPVIASASPSIQWMFPDGTHLEAPYTSEDNRISVSTTGKLIVKAVDYYDSGLYHCIATIKDDTDTMTYRVDVQPTRVHASQVEESGVTVHSGDTISLPCTAIAVPNAQLNWILPSNDVLSAPSNTTGGFVMENGTLVIKSSHVSNSGHYRCLAINKYGLDLLIVNVAVIKKLHGQQIKKGKAGRVPIPKLFIRIEDPMAEEQEGSGRETAYESQKQVTYNRYTVSTPVGRKRLHADGTHDRSKAESNRNTKLRHGPQRGRGKTATEGRRRWDSRRRVNMANKKIDPQKWADILAKVRAKTIPKVTDPPLFQIYKSTTISPAGNENQTHHLEANHLKKLNPVSESGVEESSGIGDLNFSEDELIHISSSHSATAKEHDMPENTTLSKTLVLKQQENLLQQTIRGDTNSAKNQISGASHTDPVLISATESSTAVNFLSKLRHESEIWELQTTTTSALEQVSIEPRGKIIKIQPIHGEPEYDDVSVIESKTNAPKPDAHEELPKPWMTKAITYPARKLPEKDSIIHITGINLNSDNDSTFIREDPTLTSKTVTTLITTEATSTIIRAPISSTKARTTTTFPPSTKATTITTLVHNTITKPAISTTAATMPPTNIAKSVTMKTMVPRTVAKTTTVVNINTRASQSKNMSIIASRNYPRRRLPGRRRYRPNRYRQRQHLYPIARAKETKPTQVNMASTIQPSMKSVPIEMSNSETSPIKVNITLEKEPDSKLVTVASNKLNLPALEQLTTKEPKLKSVNILTITNSPPTTKPSGTPITQGLQPSKSHQPKLLASTTPSTLETIKAIFSNLPEPGPANPESLTHPTKTLYIPRDYKLHNGTKLDSTTISPLITNTFDKPPDLTTHSDSLESNGRHVLTTTTTTSVVPVGSGKLKGVQDSGKTSDIILNPLVPITVLPITTTVMLTSKSVMNYFEILTTTTASIVQGSRETPKSNTEPKVPTVTILETEAKSPEGETSHGISTFRQNGSDITSKLPSSPDTIMDPSRFPGQGIAPYSEATEKNVPGAQITNVTSGHVPLLPSQTTVSMDKEDLPLAISPEGALPIQKAAGIGVKKQDRLGTNGTSGSNKPDGVHSRQHTVTTHGRQQVKETYTEQSNNLTWISKHKWNPDANLSIMSSPNQGSRLKSPKYIPVGVTEKTLTPTTRVWSHNVTTGVWSGVTNEPRLRVFPTVKNIEKPDEPFIKLPTATSATLFQTSPIFNKAVDADLDANSKTAKAINLPPLRHSVVERPTTNPDNQWRHHVQIPILFSKEKTSATIPQTTMHTVTVPTSTPTTVPTTISTAQLFRNTSLNKRLHYPPILPKLGGNSSSAAQLSPNFRTTKGKPKIVTRNPLTMSVKAEMDAYLPCDTVGEPKPFVFWTKVSTGAVMMASSKTLRFEVFDNGTFGIHNVQVQDRGQYLCTARNQYGTDKMVITLIVLAQPPRIVGPRYKDATVYLGEPFLAECRAEGLPNPHVSWLLPGRKLLQNPGGAGSSLTLLQNGTLSIRETAFSDRGVYKCIASNSVGADTVTVRLHIAALPPMIQQERTESISILPGQGARIHCTAKAAPPANIRWILFDGTQIRPSQFINGNLFVFPNGTLYIRNLSERDVGSYECVATNVVGVARRTVSINIQKHSATAKITVSSPQRVDISYGSVLHLDCVAAGDPGPRILWRLPSKLLVDSRYSYSKRMKVYSNGTLVVQSVTDKDAGDYLCVARNKMGDDFMVLKVNVMMKPAKIEYKQDAKHKVMYGKDLKVDCIASGLPDPEISWSLPDGTMVNSVMQSDDSGTRTRRYTVFDNGTLYFNEVGLKDEGDYTCYAVNQIGKDEMKVNVKVVAEPPAFQSGTPSLVQVAYGETCTIKCEAKGEPTPWISWYSPSNRFIPPSSKYQVMTDGTLVIHKVQRSDSGNYTCVARNTAGESKRVITVQVNIEAPSINGQKGANTVVKETGMRETRKQIDCKAEGVPLPRVMWVLSENVVVTAPYYGSRIQVHHNGTLDIRSLKGSDANQLMCIAHNEGGEARLTVHLEVLDLEKPSFTNPLSAGVAIVIGNSVNLNCSSRGNPTPETTWILPDGTRLLSGQQLSKTYHRRDGTLHITSPSSAEAGAYRCIAKNTVGSIERLVTLEIGHKPEIRNRYTSLVRILPGEKMRLDCMVGGNPQPQLSWALPNGVVLSRPQNVGRFSLLQNGSLIVHDASVYDRGTYSCKAVSELGLSLMSVAVIVIAYPPRITNGPMPVTYARHGASVKLNCMTMGIPKAEISWELPDKTRLTAVNQARLIGNKYLDPQGLLILQNPSSRDTGFYKCTAKNLLGSDSKITYVHIF
ncbi:matrix-remodeling-associated protein 5 isoform X1 [Carcharodon carcharias]|uniref:matrix-remodeling-associated protein 5 isoform X1 n=2 Tax=Carcharodon carcharias TaxID=13397 RepID=UPI001B7EF425|nr:matrix-remodeling-associated protein 5 isoform X1 [Carcharodon carcharias]XP_041055956.1 matrix-remodeling-associated protein 5 isoform X1 [Carcharodon carcharias]